MIKKRLSVLCANSNILSTFGPTDCIIESLQYDSRCCVPNTLFFALPGTKAHGLNYIEQAVEFGAAAIVYDSPLSTFLPGIIYIQVTHVSQVMSNMSAKFYDNPAEKLFIIGVTGTDGKTTTCDLIYQLLHKAGIKAALLSTVYRDHGKGKELNTQHVSTPEAIHIHKFLHEAVEEGVTHVVLEATSHALSEKTSRLLDISFSAAVITTITSEHLDFHGTREAYLDAKMNIVRQLKDNQAPIIFEQGAFFTNQISALHSRAQYTFSIDAKTNAILKILPETTTHTHDHNYNANSSTSHSIHLAYRLHERTQDSRNKEQASIPVMVPYPLSLPPFLRDLAAALLTVLIITQAEPAQAAEFIEQLTPVTGRAEQLPHIPGLPKVIIDFAHTPDAFENFLSAYKKLKKSGKIIAVFGAAGERDVSKRATMGSIAAAYCDIIILTEEDPRHESTKAICEEIRFGIPPAFAGKVFIETDRSEAIRKAIYSGSSVDSVLLLGKSHENSIDRGTVSIPWDEKACALRIMKELVEKSRGKSPYY